MGPGGLLESHSALKVSIDSKKEEKLQTNMFVRVWGI